MTSRKLEAIRLLSLFTLACGSLASAQSVEENAANIQANEANIQVNRENIGANREFIGANETDIQAIASIIDENAVNIDDNREFIGANADATVANGAKIDISRADIGANLGFIIHNANAIAAINETLDAIPTADPPNESLPYQIPPAFIVDGGWFEIRWICADSGPAECDLGMIGDGGDMNLLRNFVVPRFVGGSEADNAVNGYYLSISATDPESYWLGAYLDGSAPPEHVWLVHERGWLHVF